MERTKECYLLGRKAAALLVLGGKLECKNEDTKKESENLLKDFCGTVFTDVSSLPSLANSNVYLCGDIARANGLAKLEKASRVFVIRELSYNYNDAAWLVVGLGRVPILVHGMGVFYRRFFKPERDYFNRVRAEHAFQALTESTKPGKALRTGIYLTPVEKRGDDLHFNLLRCSSNLSGPTSNFGDNDRSIADALNAEAATLFQNPAELNHVLAQIYYNMPAVGTRKPTKAKISPHADKTKDMPRNALMAFCTFYNHLDRLHPVGMFDYGHKNARRKQNSAKSRSSKKHETGLTRLVFRLKQGMAKKYPRLAREFSITLYPESVFFMPISTNRIYTHEIRPSALPANCLPTRLGYVVRCSSTRAVHKEGQTFVVGCNRKLHPLGPPTPEAVKDLKGLYRRENLTDAIVDYKHPVLFSMNRGDYTRPQYKLSDEFRWFALQEKKEEGNLFKDLLRSVQWEQLGKGRQGTVLVRPDEKRGVPLVRTTAKFAAPAHSFQPVHEHLAQRIKAKGSLISDFNNALIENYTDDYRTMGFHSDMALDLEEGTSIALYSCYEHPERGPPRLLVIQPKNPRDAGCGREVEIPLVHNSVVTFSVDTNRRFRHKIVLPEGEHAENQWLGVTFRTSKTFVRYRDGEVLFEDGKQLEVLSRADDRRAFYKMRGRENKETEFTYPESSSTISKSDLMPPKPGDAARKRGSRAEKHS